MYVVYVYEEMSDVIDHWCSETTNYNKDIQRVFIIYDNDVTLRNMLKRITIKNRFRVQKNRFWSMTSLRAVYMGDIPEICNDDPFHFVGQKVVLSTFKNYII